MKPTLVIAGPGAGKTYDMVNLVAESIQSLDYGRILAVITFTNAATESIRSRIYSVVEFPSNLFIGTTFSFFNRFIIQPYASIFDDIKQEKVYLDININSALDSRVTDKKNYLARNAVRKKLLGYWLTKGCIPISEIGRVAATIIQNNKRVREVLCNRLQYLFVDEFQDIDTWQFRVFDEIRKGKKTRIYAVGDPEQYISGFTYQNTTARKPKSFTGIPILKFNANKQYVIT
jgi:DNA helicase-2/ATP-dependent DNA helicase PcrA